MESFDIARTFGSALMTFAIFVLIQFALSRIAALRSRYFVTAGVAIAVCVLLLSAGSAPTGVKLGAGALFLAACALHATRYRKSAIK